MNIHAVQGPSNCYVIEEDGGLMVIDAGFGAARRVLPFITDVLGRDPGDVRLVTCTHGHFDHMGGLWQLAARCRALVAIPPPASLGLRDIQRLVTSLVQRARHPGQELVELSDAPLPDFASWRSLHTPGHTQDSYCFYHEGSASLVSGDTLLGSRRLNRAVAPAYYRDADSLATSIRRLAALDPRHLYPGHGGVISGEDLLAHLALP